MDLQFLPDDVAEALRVVNINLVNEIRFKTGQPVIIQCGGEYKYLKKYSPADSAEGAVICENAQLILNNALENSVYAYTEQLKQGFVTLRGGVRIGVAGEFVTERNNVVAVKNVTSLNVRLPHIASGCADKIFEAVTSGWLKSTLIYSPPGYGKTTVLRELARLISQNLRLNVLVADERGELSGFTDLNGRNYLGDRCDFLVGASKEFVFENAVRAFTPQVIITDEVYGDGDFNALKFLNDCNIKFFAASHVTNKNELKKLSAECYVHLTGIGKPAEVYDKDFNFVCDCDTFCNARRSPVGR